jgi:hypothetical protein
VTRDQSQVDSNVPDYGHFPQLTRTSFRMARENVIQNIEYIAFSNLLNGADVPRQWNGTNFDRISMVGPGAAPSVSRLYTCRKWSLPSLISFAHTRVTSSPR